VGTIGAFGVWMSMFYLGEGGSPALALLFAGIIVLAMVFFVVLAVLMGRERAVMVSFSDQFLAWRTRAKVQRTAQYDRVMQILPWPWWAAVPWRYIVVLRADRIPPREGLWLSPENNARLENALQRMKRR